MTIPAAALVLTFVAVPQPRALAPTSIHDSIARVAARMTLDRVLSAPAQSPNKRRVSTAAKIGTGVLGGVAGFFGGMFIGDMIDRAHDCYCDDPGLNGMVIGAPIGAGVGAILGVWMVSR